MKDDDVKIIWLLYEHESLRGRLRALDAESKSIGRRLAEIKEQLPKGVVLPDDLPYDTQDQST